MTRSKFTPGAETGHYHTTLGVDETPVEQLGAQQVVSLLGPFHIAHDDVGLGTSGVQFGDLNAALTPGVMIYDAIVVATSSWTIDNYIGAPARADFYISDPQDNQFALFSWDLPNTSVQSASTYFVSQEVSTSSNNQRAIVTESGSYAIIYVGPLSGGEVLSGGEADLYVAVLSAA